MSTTKLDRATALEQPLPSKSIVRFPNINAYEQDDV